MMQNIPNNMDIVNKINEARVLNSQGEEQIAALDERFNQNEDRDRLYRELIGIKSSINDREIELKNLINSVNQELQEKEEQEVRINNRKKTAIDRYKNRSKNITMQILNDYITELETCVDWFCESFKEMYDLISKYVRLKEDGAENDELLEVKEEYKETLSEAKDIFEHINVNEVRRMTAFLFMINDRLNLKRINNEFRESYKKKMKYLKGDSIVD